MRDSRPAGSSVPQCTLLVWFYDEELDLETVKYIDSGGAIHEVRFEDQEAAIDFLRANRMMSGRGGNCFRRTRLHGRWSN
jgi:hypothetical protein